MNVELVLDAKAMLGEGPVWHARCQRLYWVNISEGELHVCNPRDRSDQAIEVGQRIGSAVPRRRGGLILAVQHGLATFDPETRGLTIIHDPESHLPDNRFNDGKCDPAGRFWAGTVSRNHDPGAGSLYRLDPNHTVHRMLTGVTTSNGIAWSLDGSTMYYIDTETQQVAAFDYRLDTGEISNRRVAVTIPEETGIPDGMTIDEDGMIWVAHWGGNCVTRWDPHADRLLQTIWIPASQVTSCTFGGPNLDELYVTTARIQLTETDLIEQPHAGALFRTCPGVRGVEAVEFAG